jgi:hypothetical protein
MGSTFEKIAKRVNKHMGKETYGSLYPMVMTRFRVSISKMIERAVKESKVTSVSCEQMEYFMSEEGAKIVTKYSKKL